VQSGCVDSLAANFNAEAIEDSGECVSTEILLSTDISTDIVLQ
jgi:hypothetical protein